MCADWAKINYGLSMVNMMLSSTQSYGNDLRTNNPYAYINFSNNIFNGMMRNNIAYGMALQGNPSGQAANAMIGYGNPAANSFGSMTLFYQNMAMHPPFMFGSPMMMPGMMGYSPFMHGPSMFWC